MKTFITILLTILVVLCVIMAAIGMIISLMSGYMSDVIGILIIGSIVVAYLLVQIDGKIKA